MIAFVTTVLLGLLTGVQPVELAVPPGVAEVELLLDGEPVATVAGAPWIAAVDFGPTLQPHRLEAVGRDAAGVEVGRIEQMVNLAPVVGDAELLLERSPAGGAEAVRVVWRTVESEAPERVSVLFDGVALPVDDSGRAALPPHDEGVAHVVQAEVEFAGGAADRADLLFGGAYGEETGTELTAVPLRAPRGVEPAALAGRLRVAGRPAEPVATEHEGADLLVVVDASAWPPLRRLGVEIVRWGGGVTQEHTRGGMRPDHHLDPAATLPFGALRENDRLYFVHSTSDAVTPASGGPPAKLFCRTPPVGVEQGGLHYQLARVELPRGEGAQALSDALASAGRWAHAGGRRRAVLLVVGPQPEDASRHGFEEVRRYLEHLRVPLHVWFVEPAWATLRQVERRAQRVAEEELEAQLGHPPPQRADRLRDARQAFGPLTDVGTLDQFLRASDAVGRDLRRQRVVWITGSHLPGELALHRPPRGVALLEGGTGE